MAAILLLWLPVVYLLSGQWTGYPHYGYGWAVPALCMYLFARRWKDRPPSGPAPRSKEAITIIGLCSALLLLAHVVQQASLTWRAASYALVLASSGITLMLIYLRGGGMWLRHLAFPVLFFFVAVPWPTPVETLIIDTLTRWNTAVTVEGLNAFGVAALQHGNVIELGTGSVGIDEACSGIRSVQANLMIALFLGEHARLRWQRRLLLIALGVLFALVFNVSRTLLLASVTSDGGPQAAARWHDPAGTAVLVACFSALWGAAALIARHEKQSHTKPERTMVGPSSLLGFQPVLLGLIAWCVLVPVASEAWFRFHERAADTPPEWTVHWPWDNRKLQRVPLSKEVRALLAFDEGDSASWRETDGTRWQMFYFRWFPARNIFRRVEVQFAKNHRPERCLPATGRTLLSQQPIVLRAASFSLPFRFYVFDDQGVPLHVYVCVRDDNTGANELANMRADSMDRLRAAWRGNRATGQQLIEVAIWGFNDPKESQAALERELEKFIVPRAVSARQVLNRPL